MKAIVFKELFENAKWAALMMLMIIGSIAFAVYGNSRSDRSLVDMPIHVVTAIGFPAMGLALGMLQILQDSRRGRWGFLTHRPISRTGIFLAKVLAGVCLYLLITAIPLAGTIAWFASSAHRPTPFEWHMVLPRIADLMSGLVGYAGGMLIAARQARWIGSRLMPLGFVLLGCVFAAFSQQFGYAVLTFGVAMLILFPAAWSAFVSNGTFETQPVAQRFLQTVIVGTGLVISCVMSLTLIGEMLRSAISRPATQVSFQRYAVSSDGRIGRVEYRGNQTLWTDLQGHPLPVLIGRTELQGVYLDLTREPTTGRSAAMRGSDSFFQSPNRYLRLLGTGGTTASSSGGTTAWFYVVHRRTIEGYDIFTGAPEGSIGPDGFVPPTRPARPFEQPLCCFQDSVVASATTAYRIDLSRQVIAPMFNTSIDDPIVDVGNYLAMNDRRLDRPAIAYVITTRSSLHVFENNSEVLKTPLEPGYPPYQQLMVGQASNGHFFLHFFAPEYVESGKEPPEWFIEADDRGHVLNRTEVPTLRYHFEQYNPWTQGLEELAFPPAFTAVLKLIRHSRQIAGYYLGWIELTWIMVIGAVITRLLTRRYELTRAGKILWTAIGLLFGLPGVLLLLSMREPVPTIRCPACGKRRFVTRELCEHCGAPFAKPVEQGIEILELSAV